MGDTPEYLSFMVRLWRHENMVYSDNQTAANAFLGNIEYVQTGQKCSFHSLGEIQDYLQNILSDLAEDQPGQEREADAS